MMLGAAFVLTANFVSLFAVIVASATTITVTTLTQGRRARRDAAELQRTVVEGYFDTVKRVDGAHDEVRTGNGKSAGKYVVDIAGAFDEHRLEDATNFGVIGEGVRELRVEVAGLRSLVESTVQHPDA